MKEACAELCNSTTSTGAREVAATMQACSTVRDSVVSRADLLQNISLSKKKTSTKDLIYTEG